MNENKNNLEDETYIAEEIDYILSKNKMIKRELTKIDRKIAKKIGFSDEIMEMIFSKY
jgi:arsenate reductase-like glutaredoxin family protein